MEQVLSSSSPPSANRSEASAPGLLRDQQHTLTRPLAQSGVGLHLGELTQVRILPAQPGDGRYFVRVDLPGQPAIPAHIDQVRETRLSTELAVETDDGRASVRTVEHLLAALVGMGIDNARIEIDGPEVPLLDGSAQDWARAIAAAGITAQPVPRALVPLPEPVWVRHDDAFVAAIPAPELRFSYGIDFDLPAIGNQWISWSPSTEPFETAIAPARTFGLAHQIDQLRSLGLIRGGSLDNALVCGPDGWLNPPLRFSNEPVRHKLLDLVGDISLLGWMPLAHLVAYKASHQLHTDMARRLRLSPFAP
ncbi:UDP-3-O-acyl-N-acetylglucosamine deacetylase [Thermoleptolyngbya sp. C42_A2020_037]|uniref:UDP-3-O-acyl-N-acetylglucosamine deacetylase n=1 Tax=Thermoleptolyngbya sp. C42_A2020_037 TaxID=2747799 RepID=UPI0019DF889A|nr:UDP-3-O-acyl-N-acetylglucosamine deacetylase [Thermoleptolyngbya sp. C42_A2020_037]MBF2085581.1 UDP-3-O-acyl-N-acetylglucosamine deacetylase [Thermoleptolyngbya sp. C42_A2020_037]